MKKILLVLICFSTFFYSSAQNKTKCLTCKNGMHDGMMDKVPANNLNSNVMVGGHVPNGSGTFGQSYLIQNLCGLNYIMNGLQTTTRYTNSPGTGFPTTVAMAGLPGGFVAQKAYVYYGVSYTEVTPPPTSVVITNPALVNATIASVMIGNAQPVCWGETGTATYRCDVTSMISGNGNYVINLTGFVNAASEVDGVTLIIVYVDPNATYSGNIVLWDGDMADFTGTSMTYTGNGFTACTNSSAGSAFSLQGDCQNNIIPNTNTDDYNGSIASFPNNFWNTNVVATSVAACANSAKYTGYTNNTNDCWLWSMIGLYWQYTTCASCSAMTVTSVDVNPSCGNNNGSIIVNVVGGTPPYTYTWTPNVSSTNSATGLSAGTYQITVQDGACNVQTINVTLTMVNLIVTNTQTNILCNGQSTGSASFTVGGGVSPYTYSWAPIVNTTSSANGLSAGSYTVIIEDSNGCKNTTIFSITQPAALTAPTTTVGALCNGMSDGQATVTVGGGTPPYTYSWAPVVGTTFKANNLSAGTYTVNVTDQNGCIISAFADITQPAPLAVSISGPAVVCIDDSGTYTANTSGGTTPYAYTWKGQGLTSLGSTASVAPPATENDTVKITDANGCTASADITITLGPTMTVSINGPASICKGLSTTLCANIVGGTGGNIYTWQPGNLATPCITVNPSGTTTYTLKVVDNCGTTATTIKTLNVKPLPATAFATNLSRGCAPLCIQFYNTTTLAQGSASSYVWTFGNGDSSSAQNPIYCFPLSGSYNIGLTVVSDSGCSSTLNKVNMITAYARPAGAFTYSPNPASILDPTIQFTDKSTDQYNIIYWLWSFGDISDSSSNIENPTHTYQDTGSYCVNMVAMDEHGCTDTVTNCLIIEPNFNLYIPSAFTPNGDNRNQTFEPKGDYIKTFEMYIFDRWGMLLYHTTDISKGWDGTVGGGSIAQEDTYVYKILVTDTRKHQHTYVGNVTLLK